jgi:hypothetical protein
VWVRVRWKRERIGRRGRREGGEKTVRQRQRKGSACEDLQDLGEADEKASESWSCGCPAEEP